MHKYDVSVGAQYKLETGSIFGTVLYDPTVTYNIMTQSNIVRMLQ